MGSTDPPSSVISECSRLLAGECTWGSSWPRANTRFEIIILWFEVKAKSAMLPGRAVRPPCAQALLAYHRLYCHDILTRLARPWAQADSETYMKLCRAGDAKGVLKLLTHEHVEEKVLQRAFMKASTYGRDIDVPTKDTTSGAVREKNPHFKVDPQMIVSIYRDLVIPLTKDVEVLYLFQRTGYPCPSLDNIHETHPNAK